MKTMQNQFTRTLPTNKAGAVYYGPKTVSAAAKAIQVMGASPAQVIADMRKAGYARAAAIVASQYGEE
jgi:hypothetical protein